MIKNLLKQQIHKKNVAVSNRSEIIATHPLSTDEEKDSLMDNNVLKDVGRPKGTTYLAQDERREKIEDMKNDIVDGWVDKLKSKAMKMKDWILRNQNEFGFAPTNLKSTAEKKAISVKSSSFIYSRTNG